MPADPIFAAIERHRAAFAAMEAAEFEFDGPETADLYHAECRAVIDALRTVPTTPAGLRAFCEFGAAMSQQARTISFCGLGDWTPGGPLGDADVPTVEEMFFDTLAASACAVLPETEGAAA